MDRLVTGADGIVRCWWCGDDPLYVAYHDDEWGRPTTDELPRRRRRRSRSAGR